MADQPYIKWWTSDFLTGVIDLTAEEAGVYAIILTMMADRGGPVPCADAADRQWLARRTNLTTRAFGRALTRLIDLGKLTERNGLLVNKRMMAEIKERDSRSAQARAAAEARWDKWAAEHPATLPFDAPEQRNFEKTGRKSPVKLREKPAEKPAVKKAKTAENRQSGPKSASSPFVRARDTVRAPKSESESEETNPTHPLEAARAGPGRAEDESDQGKAAPPPGRSPDLRALYEAVAEASGHNPVVPGQIDRAFTFVQDWHRLGIDFDTVVLPTIRSAISATNEPTRTLGRFDAAIKHQHARQAATPKGSGYRPPASPLMEPDDEDARFRPIRAALLERLGAAAYSTMLNPVRFTATEKATGEPVLRITDQGTGHAARLKDGSGHAALLAVAHAHGFGDVW